MTQSLFDLKKMVSPKEFSTALRDLGLIKWWDPGNFWLITDYKLAQSLLNSKDVTCDRSPFFISRMPNIDLSLLGDFFDVVSRMMVMRDADLHKRSRRICYHGFASKHLSAMLPSIKSNIAKAIKKIENKSHFDFMEYFANIIPMTTLADFFDIPERDRQEFVSYAKIMTGFFGGASDYTNQAAIEVNQAARKLKQYFTDLYQQRSGSPKADFFSSLILHQEEFSLSKDDLIAQAIMMWVAGMVTTSDQMANNAFSLLNDFPELIYDNLSFDEFGAAIQEASRLDPAVTFTFRLADRDIHLDDHIIKQGQTIFISNHAVNRDPQIFDKPDYIDIEAKSKHLSYGFGPHFCLGAKLAQMEMHHTLYQLVKARDNLQVIDHKRLHYSLSFSGFESLILQGQ